MYIETPQIKKAKYGAKKGEVESFAFTALADKLLEQNWCFSIDSLVEILADEEICSKTKAKNIYAGKEHCPENIYVELVRIARNCNGTKDLQKSEKQLFLFAIEYNQTKTYEIGDLLMLQPLKNTGVVTGKEHKNKILVTLKSGEKMSFVENTPDDPLFNRHPADMIHNTDDRG